MNKTACITCDNNFCSELPGDIRTELCSRRIVMRAKRKKSLIFDARQIVIVRSGVFIPSFLREDGKEIGLSLKKPGSLLGVGQMFTDRERMFNLYIIADFEGCVFSVSHFESLFEKYHEFAKLAMRKCIENLTSHSEFVVDIALSDSESKVQALQNLIDSNSAFSGIKLTHEEMAVLLGINRVTVTKVVSGKKKGN